MWVHCRWHEERKLRISSTKAHTILVKKDEAGLQKAAEQLCKRTSFSNEAMQYGMLLLICYFFSV